MQVAEKLAVANAQMKKNAGTAHGGSKSQG